MCLRPRHSTSTRNTWWTPAGSRVRVRHGARAQADPLPATPPAHPPPAEAQSGLGAPLLSRDPPTLPHTWGLCPVQSVPQEPGPPSAELANPSGPETLDKVSPDRLGRRARAPEPGVRGPHCIRRGEIRWVPAPLPIHCPCSPCGLSRAPPTGCELPASAHRAQPNSRTADPRPLRASPASSSLQAPPRAFPRAAGSCKGPIRLDPRRREAGAAL